MPHKGERLLLMTMAFSLSNEILTFLRASPNTPIPFGRDPVAISQGLGKLESRLWEDENLRGRINKLTENLAKGRKRILI